MSRHSLVFWNLHRLFGPAGNPIQHALAAGDPAVAASAREVDQKLTTIAAVLDAVAARAGPPLVVGFVEIESADLARVVAERVAAVDLACVDDLAEDQTGFALDGLNVTALVDRDLVGEVSLLRSHVIDQTFSARDVLECDLLLADGTDLSVLVNHWPSRLVGEAAGKRIAAAHYVNRLVATKTRYQLAEMWDPERHLLDLPNKPQMRLRARTPVVAMGDFNDEVFDASLDIVGSTSDLDAVRHDLDVRGRTKKSRFTTYTASVPRLYNPMWRYADGTIGSYYRSPRWRTYDQVMLGRGLVEPRAPWRYVEGSGAVFSDDVVERPDGATWRITNAGGKPIPFDLDRGRGCSDHFPVYVQLRRA